MKTSDRTGKWHLVCSELNLVLIIDIRVRHVIHSNEREGKSVRRSSIIICQSVLLGKRCVYSCSKRLNEEKEGQPKMPKRKALDDDRESEQGLPLPIQTFLWRQTSPFIRPRLNKMQEATCLEVKEACKSFEKVLVQNIQFGLSPSLTEAICSITRWKFVQAAFPHVMHCCAALLYKRKDQINRLGSGEMKLLYTIHWILLDAAEECADSDLEHGLIHNSPFYYIFPVTVIEIFIYLFGPLFFCFRESDFQNFRMENGLKMWQALWEYRAPEVSCFTTYVKPMRTLLRGKRGRVGAVNKFGDVFLGAGKISFEEASTNSSPGGEISNGSGSGAKTGPNAERSPLLPQQEEPQQMHTGSSAQDELQSSVTFIFDYPVDSPREQQKVKDTTEVEPMTPLQPLLPPQVAATQGPRYGERWKQAGAAISRCSKFHTQVFGEGLTEGKESLAKKFLGYSKLMPVDVTMATFMDVAVLRCLFVPQWLEEGIFWALQYLSRRLDDIYNDTANEESPRKRSNSLPIPKIEISLYRSPGPKKQEHEAKDHTTNYITDSPFLQRVQLSERHRHHRHSSERSRLKKMKMSDLRAFVDSKLRSKSDKQLENIGSRPELAAPPRDEAEVSSEDQEVAAIANKALYVKDADNIPPRPQSALAKLVAQKSEPEQSGGIEMMSEMIRGKSMPSLRHLEDKPGEEVCVQRTSRSVREKGHKRAVQNIPNPIITVTEHTPTPSPDHHLKRGHKKDGKQDDSDESQQGGWMPRSQTDSNISYQTDEVSEASGTACYITKEGKLDYFIILKAIHAVTLKENLCSVRVCEVILNLLDILMDLTFFKHDASAEEVREGTNQEEAKQQPQQDKNSSEPSAHHFLMDSLVRVYMHLGCPHGCGDGHRGPPADFLRSQGHSTLGKLHHNDKSQFRKFFREFVVQHTLSEIMDFFHAFVGFCVDPSSSISPIGQKRGKASETTLGYATNFGATLNETEYRGVEGLVLTYIFKALVSRLVESTRELASPDNMALYCDVRQLMTYIKEAHGGIFRRVALSGLLDSTERPHRKKREVTTCVTRVFRHSQSVDPDEARDSPHSPTLFYVEEHGLERHSGRKSFFRKKSSNVRKAPSNQSIFDENDDYCPSPVQGQSPGSTIMRPHVSLTPRLSISEEEPTSSTGSPTGQRRKMSRFQFVNWMKKDKNHDYYDDDITDSPGADGNGLALERPSRRPSQIHRMMGKGIGPKSSASVSLTLLRARKRVEDHLYKFGIGRNKNKHGSFEEPQEYSRRNSPELDKVPGEPEIVILKERKLVDVAAIKQGMKRFSFLLETCQPGSVPDPQLLAALLDLQAPIVARAAFILECAYFVHRCNKGQWPTWMKLNLPMFRPSGPLANRGTPSGLRRTHILQRAAGKMFYQWAEAIGKRLEELMLEENLQMGDIITPIMDENKRRQLKRDDEEEDFLDEGSVNQTGSECPIVLKLVACQLLLEITAFLRETYQYLPKSSRLSHRDRDRPVWDRLPNPNRRWSMGLGSMGFSQTSAQSLISMPDFGHPGAGYQPERKISFVIQDSEEPESANSSNTTLTMPGEEAPTVEEKKGRKIAQGRAHLLRRGGPSTGPLNASFKRRSFRLKKMSGKKENEEEAGIKRSDSIKSKRKVSAISDRSDTSEHAEHDISGEDSPGILSDEQQPESPVEGAENDDVSLTCTMPWMKVVVQLSNSYNFICPHQQFCHPKCYRRQMRAAFRLMRAVRKIFGERVERDFLQKQEELFREKLREKDEKRDKKMARKVVSNQPGMGSPVRRKESFGRNQDKIDRISESEVFGAIRSRPGSTTHLAKDATDSQHAMIKDQADAKVEKNKEENRELVPILRYMQTQVQGLFHCTMSMVIKGCMVSNEDIFADIMPVAWELLLESDQQLVGSAAVAFILAAVKVPEQVTELLCRELQHEDPTQRISAILRFQALWRCRFQTWPRMEEGAQQMFKIPPPGIDFTLPSPKIGLETSPVIDPPWMPHYKTKVEEVTINQDQTVGRSFVTATKTRKKQQMEMVQSALRAEEDKKRISRENFMLTSVPITTQAAYEPALYHAVEEHDEIDDDHSDQQRPVIHHIQVATSVFPSCLCTAAIPIINLLDDATIGSNGEAVYEVAYQAVWTFLVEDPALFLRYFLEKLTRERQEEMIQLLRRLLRFIPELPPQAGYALFNYMVGYIMFYVRTPVEGGQDMMGNAMSLLCMVVSSIQGVYLKDLKQILRKEQCDTTLLITANVPSAKKVVVHGPDAAGIPSQFPTCEDTQFLTILQDSLEFFGIDETQKKEWHLVDHKTNQMHNLNAYVRDFYFFKRSQYPQLSLIRMSPNDAFVALQKQAFSLKFIEIGKVLLTLSVLKTSHQIAARVFFLHEELQKLPSFPRKALEAELGLYTGPMGKELLGLDMLHKYAWVKLVARMFEAMAGTFAYSSDIHLFINVINGALVLHCEDSAILRECMAILINASQQFKNVFASNGYFLIMPTLLRIYSSHQTNLLLCQTIEFVCKQFYIIHQKPFILQMFGCVAPLLDTRVSGPYAETNKVDPKCLFQLLLGLEQIIPDPLEIMELVEVEKPLKALDFCYQMDPETFSVLDAISLCVTVVAYAADSTRGHQMLTILEAVLPFYLKHLQSQAKKHDPLTAARMEIQSMHQLAGCMKALINNCEALTKNYTGPQSTGNPRSSSIRNVTKTSYSPAFDFDEDNHPRFLNDLNSRKYQEREMEDSQLMQNEFRKPRSALLNVIAEFMSKCFTRYYELCKKIGQDSKSGDLMDTKCHMRLADVAHSLLKISPYDPVTMACKGLQRYMNEILPVSDWSQESLRPALMMISRRLDKTFNKISKKPAIRRNTDWDAAASLLKGIYLTLSKHPYVAHIPHLKSLISVCQGIILGDPGTNPVISESVPASMSSSAILNQIPPHNFCSVVVKLIAMQMLVLRDTLSFEQICGGSASMPNPDKVESLLLNLILPLCVRVGCGRRDNLVIRQSDISFALSVLINTLNPPAHKPISVSQASNKSDLRTSMSFTERSQGRQKQSLFHVAFLGLKIFIICFESQLTSEWHRIARCVREIGYNHQGGLALWNFLDFTVTHRTPLYIVLLPYIVQKLSQTDHLYEQEYQYRELIKEKIQGFGLTPSKCKAVLLLEFANELRKLQQEITNKRSGDNDPRKSLISDSAEESLRRPYAVMADANTEQHLFGRLGGVTGITGTRRLVTGTSMSSGSVSSPKESTLTREWSVRSEKGAAFQASAYDVGRRTVERFLRRTSYPEGENQSAQDLLKSQSPTASSEPRLTRFTRRSTRNIHKRSGRSGSGTTGSSSVPSVGTPEEGETPTSPGSPKEHGQGDTRKHRLQRQMAQSRKTFRFRSMKKPMQMVGLQSDAHEVHDQPPLDIERPTPLVEEGASTSSNVPHHPLVVGTIPEMEMQPRAHPPKLDFHGPRRRGAMHIRSRSPSLSPEHLHLRSDAYVAGAAQSDSGESVTHSENSALLAESCTCIKTSSQTSLLMYDSKDENTLL